MARELDRQVIERGKSKMVLSGNGSELTSKAILTWADQSRVAWHYIAPGKPMQNAFIESFNGGSGTNCWTRRCLPHWPRPASRSDAGTRLQRCTPTLARLGWKTPSGFAFTCLRAGIWRCAKSRAPRQLPSLPPPNRANPSARANSGLDKTWGKVKPTNL